MSESVKKGESLIVACCEENDCSGWADKIHGQTLPLDGSFLSLTRKEPVGWGRPAVLLTLHTRLACADRSPPGTTRSPWPAGNSPRPSPPAALLSSSNDLASI